MHCGSSAQPSKSEALKVLQFSSIVHNVSSLVGITSWHSRRWSKKDQRSATWQKRASGHVSKSLQKYNSKSAKTMPNILYGISQIAENESILWVSRLGHDFYFPGQSFLDSPTGKSWNNAATRPRIEFNGDMFAECVLLAIAVCVNLALFVATIKGIPLLFMPWMLFYGFEVLAGCGKLIWKCVILTSTV